MGVAEEKKRLILEIKGIVPGLGPDPRTRARRSIGPDDEGLSAVGRGGIDGPSGRSKDPGRPSLARPDRPEGGEGSPDVGPHAAPMIDGGAGRSVRDSTGEGQGPVVPGRSGVRVLAGDPSRSPTDRDDPQEGGQNQAGPGGPSGWDAVEPTAGPPSASDRLISGDLGMVGPPSPDGEPPGEGAPPTGGDERRSGVVPAGGESDPTLELQQLPGAMRRLQDRADALEQVVNRALNRVILSQGMMAKQLARLDQSSRQSLQAAEQAGQYLDQTGPSALSFGGP